MRPGGAPVLALFMGLVLSPGAALDASPADDTVVKVIALRHRPAADLVPILRPLVGPDGGLDALDTRLVVRATPQALARIEQALVELDRPLRSLLITVSQGLRRSSEREGSGAGGVQSQTSEGGARQQVRTVEGGPALIRVGRSEPVSTVEVVPTPAGPTLVQGTAYAEAGTGFYVRPRLAGDMVTLELWAESTEGTPSGAIEGQRLGSTVVGRLGEWIEVGSALREAETNVRSLGGAARGTTVEERSVRLRVDEVR